MAERAHIEGTVVIRLVLDSRGDVKEIAIVDGSLAPCLRGAAEGVVRSALIPHRRAFPVDAPPRP